jgi:hypothetical protein
MPDLLITSATQNAIDEGVHRFEKGLFWEAHEAWEEAWLVEEGDVRLGLQALIQMTAAFHKGLRMKNPRAMVTLLDASLEKLDHIARLGSCFAGIDLTTLRGELRLIRNVAATGLAEGCELPAAPILRRCQPSPARDARDVRAS